MVDYAKQYYDNFKPFSQYVHSSTFGLTEFAHSGVLSPIATLAPDTGVRVEYGKRRKALLSLIRQMNDYPIAQRAVTWIADYDTEPTLRQIARRALGLPGWDGNSRFPSRVVPKGECE